MEIHATILKNHKQGLDLDRDRRRLDHILQSDNIRMTQPPQNRNLPQNAKCICFGNKDVLDSLDSNGIFCHCIKCFADAPARQI